MTATHIISETTLTETVHYNNHSQMQVCLTGFPLEAVIMS